MQVKWLRTAAQNLDDETNYLAKDNPKVAKAFFGHIIKNVNQLKNISRSWSTWSSKWH